MVFLTIFVLFAKLKAQFLDSLTKNLQENANLCIQKSYWFCARALFQKFVLPHTNSSGGKGLIRVNTSEFRTAAACHRYRRQIYRACGTPAAHHRDCTVPYRMCHLDRVHHRYHAGAFRPVFHHDSFHACSSQQAFTQGLIPASIHPRLDPFHKLLSFFPPPSLASLYCYTSVLQ